MAALAVVSGLLFGSFLNVCIARLPQHLSVAFPGSHCPMCEAPIRPIDNIPLLSFLLLRGRCRDCRGRISLRYPLVEAALGALFLFSALRFPHPVVAAECALFCFLLLGLLVMDARTFLLPDSFTLPGVVLGIAVAAAPPGGLIRALHFGSDAPFLLWNPSPLAGSLAGALGAAATLWLIRWLYWIARRREGMGLGDLKLAALLGAWLGIAGVALALVLSILLAAATGLVLIMITVRQRRSSAGPLRLPFGSFLCAGGLLVVFFGQELLKWYFSFFV